MANRRYSRRYIEREDNGVICIACGRHYMTLELRPDFCPAEPPHFRYATEWIRAYQAGPEWCELLPAGYEQDFKKHHEVLMKVKLPPVDRDGGLK